MRKIIFILMAVMLALPTVSMARFQAGDKEMTLSGTGESDNDLRGNQFGVSVGLGYFFSDVLEGVLRQDLNYIDFADGGSDYRGSTALGVDFHLPLQNWQPFLGALVGFAYGDGIRDTWFASPEVGLKYFVNPTTFIQGLVQYQWFWRSTSDFDTNFDDGRFVYGLGIGFRF